MTLPSWIGALVLVAGCTSFESASTQTVDGNGVQPDTDSPEANAVVFVGGCSGTLITPQIVLTANHCTISDDGPCVDFTSMPVSVGMIAHLNSFGTAAIVRRNQRCATGIGGLIVRSDSIADDLALVYLATPITPSSLKDATLTGTTPQPTPKIFTPTLLSPGGALFGVSGYAEATGFRHVKYFDSDGIDYSSEDGSTYWKINNSDWNTGTGDSGGPLFVVNPDGTRHVVGVLHGWYEGIGPRFMDWADITRPGNNSWLLGNITEGNVPAELRHTAAWLARHGKTTNSWWGQVDYTGPCVPGDTDCDGWFDANDNCPKVANSDQADANDDGRGDACQACPWDTTNDPDGDGVCDHPPPHSPPWTRGDNCPLTWNPNQANCNAEAEDAEQTRNPNVEVLGDACDPVPCPAPGIASALARTWDDGQGLNPQFGGFASGRVIADQISIKRVAPRVKSHSWTVNEVVAPLTRVDTGSRFCQRNLALGYFCRAPENLRDAHFADSTYTDVLDPAHPWHRMSIPSHGLNPTVRWTYDNTKAVETWAYADDYARWTSTNVIPPADDAYQAVCTDVARVGPGTCLDGTVWYHAVSPVGFTSPVSGSTTVGIHLADRTNSGGGGAPNLANGYLDLRPDRAYATFYSGRGLMRALFLRIPLGDPAPYEALVRSRMRPLVAEQVGQPAQVIEDQGGAWAANELVSPALQGYLDYGYTWLSAAEPPGVGATYTGALHAVAVDALGTQIAEAVVSDGPTLRLAQELGYNFNSYLATGAPTPRTGWIGTFSRALGGVIVMGGSDATTGEQLHDAHLWRDGLGWTTIPIDGGLEMPISAVYSPADRRLWILEREGGDTIELVRVDPFTGESISAGRWLRDDATWDHHFLAIDRDGHVLLVAASAARQRSSIARLRVETSGRGYAMSLDEDLPYTTSEPLVDADEYGLIIRDGGDAITGIYRRAALVGRTAPLDGMFW